MFMEKIEAPRATCDLFGVESGFYGNGNGGHISGDKPRSATEAEARAYADFIRRKCNLPDLGKVALQHTGYRGGQAPGQHFHYRGATYGEEIGRGEYQEGAFSVLFPGANMMRATVTMETLDESGEVISSQTMPVEPKKGGVLWSRDDVRKAAGPVAKPKRARKAPTRSRAAPIPAEAVTIARLTEAEAVCEVLRAEFPGQTFTARHFGPGNVKIVGNQGVPAREWSVPVDEREPLERARDMAAFLEESEAKREARAKARQIAEERAEPVAMTADTPEAPASDPEPLSCQPAAYAAPITAERGKRSVAERRAILRAWQMRAAMRRMRAEASPEPEPVPAEVMADIAEAGRLIRCEGYVAPIPTAIQRPKRTPAHERAIRRAWAERKARRNAKSAAITAETCARSAEAREARLREQLDNADQMRRDWLHSAEAAHKRERIANIKRRRAVLKARDLQTRLYAGHRLVDRANDRRRLAEQEAAEALAAREDLKRMLADAEARLAAAEAENAQLWAEIEALTAPTSALAS